MDPQSKPLALVTGASSGIGAAVVRRLVADGYRVLAFARRIERLEAMAEELGEAVYPVYGDLRDERSILGAFDLGDDLGGVDLLVNNAGLGYDAPLTSGSTEHWREMLEVNVLGLCVATREAVARMQRRGVDGHIVHISSMSGHRVPQGSGMYAGTKYAVRALTEALRMELREQASGIRISCVSPGTARTEFAAKYHGSESFAEEQYSAFEVLTADDIADTVSWVVKLPPRVQIHDILMRGTHQVS